MTYEQIAEALRSAGYTWVSAAAAIGKSRAAVVRVAGRHIKSRFIARSLAVLLDMEVSEVFPDVPEYQKPPRDEQRQQAIARARKKLQAAGIRAAA